ncbi:MAG: BON domain-containing protein [Chloroflexi bacterium]|nr:BON domain-containing protein [Chloroflexota bacterium]
MIDDAVQPDAGILSQRIVQVLAEVGLPIVVEDDGATLRLVGRVDTLEARTAAADVARAVAPGRHLANDLEVDEVWPETAPAAGAWPAAIDLPNTVQEVRTNSELEPDFTDQVLETSPVTMADAAGATIDPRQDGEAVFFPPTDPVVTIGDDGQVEVLGGFAPTAMDGVDALVPPSALDGQLGDEAIADGVRLALRRDALTTDLAIDVAVREGVVYLRGSVLTLDDIDGAEDVASRVPGVVEVIEELAVVGL